VLCHLEGSGLNVIKLSVAIVYEYSECVIVFVPDRQFQLSLNLASKARSLPSSEAPEKCFTRIGSGLTSNLTRSWEGLTETSTQA
jgi:hypothetical protein